MVPDDPTATNDVAWTQWQRIDPLCERFETAMTQGERPAIGDYLAEALEGDRGELLYSLLRLELEFRRRAGEACVLDDYLSQWPQEEAVIHRAFGDREPVTSPPAGERGSDQPTASGDGSEAPSSSLPLGSKVKYFGDYEILEELGAGGMGVVYKARQTKLKKIVALKMIRAGHLASDEAVRRFQSEAQAAAKLEHPGIVPVHEVGVHAGQHYYTMDYVGGESLAKLHRDEPVAARRAAELVQQLAAAMHYAHGQGIVHRDLKPANVLLTASGTPRITDFGLAKRLQSDQDSAKAALTETGQVLGTAGYMAPEQAAGKTRLVGPPADIYALGAVLYALLTSRPPFVGESQADTILQVIHNEPVSPRVLNPSIARDLETICLKCLEKEPHKRYGTAQLLADDLGRFLERRPVLARPISRPARAWRWCRRNALVSSLVATSALFLVVVALLTTVGYITQSRQARELQAENARTNQNLYFVGVRLALEEVQNGNMKAARDLLDRSPRDYRHWEWHWLSKLCDGGSDVPLPSGTVPVLCRAFSPDGKLITVASLYDSDGTMVTAPEIRLIDVVTAKEVAKYEGVALGYSPDSQSVAVASRDGAIDLIEISSGERKHRYQLNPSATYGSNANGQGDPNCFAPCFSPDGRFVAGYQFCSNLTLWRVGSDKPFLKLTLPLGDLSWDWFEHAIWLLGSFRPDHLFSPDGKTLAFPSASDPTVVSLWNLDEGIVTRDLVGHKAPVLAIQYSSDGSRIASIDKDYVAKIWNAFDGTLVFETESVGARLSFSPDSKSVVVAIESKTEASRKTQSHLAAHRIEVHDAANGELKWTHELTTSAVDFSGDGELLFASDIGGSLHVFSSKTGTAVPLTFLARTDRMSRLERSRGDAHIAIINERRVDVVDPKQHLIGNKKSIRYRYRSDGSVAWIIDGTDIVLLDLATGRETFRAEGSRYLIGQNGMGLAISDSTSTTIWGFHIAGESFANAPKPIIVLQEPGIPIAFSTQRRLLISERITNTRRAYVNYAWTSNEPAAKEIVVWRFDEGSPLLTFNLRTSVDSKNKSSYLIRLPDSSELDSNILGVVCSPDSQFLAALCGSAVWVWDCGSGHRKSVLSNSADVTQAMFAPDARCLVSVCQPKAGSSEVSIWNPTDGTLLKQFGHVGAIDNISFSTDGRHILFIGKGQIQIRSAFEGKLELSHAGGDRLSTSLSPNGRFLVTRETTHDDYRIVQVTDGSWVEIPGSTNCQHIAFSPDCLRVAAVDRASDYQVYLRIFDTVTGTNVFRWRIPDDGGGGSNFDLQVSPDGSEILVSNLRLNSRRPQEAHSNANQGSNSDVP